MRLRADATVEQFLLAPRVGLGVDPLGLNPSQITLGSAQLVLLISRIENSQQRALLHFTADVNGAPRDAARHAKAQIAFVARLDGAGESAEVFLILGFHFNRQHRTYRFGRRFFLGTSHQQHAGRH